MSDRVVIPGPAVWLNNGRASVDPEPAAEPGAAPVETGGGGPHGPDMEPRVASLEADMKDVKGTLQRVELVLAELKPAIAALPTKADLATIAGRLETLDARVSGLDKRVGSVETAVVDMRRDQKTDFYWLLSIGGGTALALLGLVARGFHWVGG